MVHQSHADSVRVKRSRILPPNHVVAPAEFIDSFKESLNDTDTEIEMISGEDSGIHLSSDLYDVLMMSAEPKPSEEV